MGAEALARARAGDLEALAELLERHGAELGGRLAARIPAAHRAVLDPEDVLQVTYLEAFLRIADFRGEASAFAGWLGAIAENNLCDGLRELGRAKRPDSGRRMAGDAALALFEALGSGATSPTRAAARGEAQARLHAALAELPRDYARVVALIDLEGRSVEEAASELARSRGAVHMLRLRAHERLRERLGAAERYLSTGRGSTGRGSTGRG